MPRLRVLDDVRQRLLHHPVERRLDLARQPLLAELRFEVEASRSAPRRSRARRSSAGHEAEVVERLRPQLDSQTPHVVQRLEDLLADLGERPRARLGAPAPPRRPSGRAAPRSAPGRSGRAARARGGGARAPAPRRRGAARRSATRSERSTATAARFANVSARRRSSSVNRGSSPCLVVGDDDSDRPVARRSAARRGRCARRVGAADSWSTSGSSSSESTRSPRRRSSTRPLFEPARLELRADDLARRRSPSAASITSVPSAVGQRDRDDPRVDQLAQAARDQLEQARQVDLGRERVPTSFSASSCRDQRRGRLVQARVLDRDRRLAASRPTSSSSSLGEVGAARLLGQVEVAEGDRRAAGPARRGSCASADGSAGSRPSAGPRRDRAGAAARRRGSARRGCRARAGGRRSRRASRRRCPW